MKDSQRDATRAMIDTYLARLSKPDALARKNRPPPTFSVYWENLGWAQLFGFDMNHFIDDLRFQIETTMKMRLWHLDNWADDTGYGPDLGPTVGMYWEYSLLGMRVGHQADGVPILPENHPMRRSPDLSLLARHDFLATGEMPRILRYHEEATRLVDGKLKVSFPVWGRGPFDIAVQLRGYEGIIDDMRERPVFVHALMRFITEERIRWWDAYCSHFGLKERTCGIADDWVNVPFISPAMFEEFILPSYFELERYHGSLGGFHTCADQVPIQKLLLRLPTLRDFEVTPWTDLEATLRNVPADKNLTVHIKNVDVLLSDDARAERQLRRIRTLCEAAGRKFSVCGQALSRVHKDMADDVRQVQRWIAVARRVLHD